jgi:hypothetical protein
MLCKELNIFSQIEKKNRACLILITLVFCSILKNDSPEKEKKKTHILSLKLKMPTSCHIAYNHNPFL